MIFCVLIARRLGRTEIVAVLHSPSRSLPTANREYSSSRPSQSSSMSCNSGHYLLNAFTHRLVSLALKKPSSQALIRHWPPAHRTSAFGRVATSTTVIQICIEIENFVNLAITVVINAVTCFIYPDWNRRTQMAICVSISPPLALAFTFSLLNLALATRKPFIERPSQSLSASS